jgi:hypothetical protein
MIIEQTIDQTYIFADFFPDSEVIFQSLMCNLRFSPNLTKYYQQKELIFC